jgi:hypothetical protein
LIKGDPPQQRYSLYALYSCSIAMNSFRILLLCVFACIGHVHAQNQFLAKRNSGLAATGTSDTRTARKTTQDVSYTVSSASKEDFVAQKQTVTAVAYAGGGFRAMSASIGFTKALDEVGPGSEVSMVSSVSGGTWFSVLREYSQDFYDKLNNVNVSAEEFTRNVLEQYLQNTKCNPSLANAYCALDKSKLALIDELILPFMPVKLPFGGRTINLALSNGWEGYVTKILGSDIGALPAAQSTRHNPNGPDLLMCTTLPDNAVLTSSTASLRVSAYTSSSLEPLPDTQIPVAYYIARANSGYFLPLEETTEAPSLKVVDNSTGSVEPLAVAKMPTVGLIAAASSAPADKLVPVIEQAMPALGDLSYVPVCTDAGPCNAPKYRFWDGGYVDNTGVGMLVGKLQQKHGLDVMLRIFLVDSTGLDTYALFSADNSTKQRIFAPSESNIAEDIMSTESMRYERRRVQTVANSLFGVQGGQTVEVLVLMAGGLHGLETDALEIESSDDVAVGAALAQDVYALVSESLQTEAASPKRSEKGLHGK